MHEGIVTVVRRSRSLLYLFAAFAAGCVLSGIFFYRQRSRSIGELDQRYGHEYTGAAETIGRLEEELGKERELNRALRDHNSRARELAEGLADSSQRNVRNLQDAVGLIGEIRKKLTVLAEFYADSGSRGGTP